MHAQSLRRLGLLVEDPPLPSWCLRLHSMQVQNKSCIHNEVFFSHAEHALSLLHYSLHSQSPLAAGAHAMHVLLMQQTYL